MWRWFGIPWLMRRWAYRRGLRSQNDLTYFLALLYVGRTAFLRRSARVRGVYGREPVWLAVAGVFFAKDLVTKLTVKEVDVLTTETLRAGDSIRITSVPPSRRRGRRAAS